MTRCYCSRLARRPPASRDREKKDRRRGYSDLVVRVRVDDEVR
jgi:hypothetical protein